MMKSVLRVAKPYWIYLILKGIKTCEVGKDCPASPDWNRVVEMYCSKDMKSFNRIPEEDRGWMRKYLGKVACRFVCDRIDKYCGRLTTYAETPYKYKYISHEELAKTCLSIGELNDYLNGSNACLWHISDLNIYDVPKELYDYLSYKKHQKCLKLNCFDADCFRCTNNAIIVFPPQSWFYVEA